MKPKEQHLSTAPKFFSNSKYIDKIFVLLKFGGSILDIVEGNILGIIRFQNGLTERVTIRVFAQF